MSDAHPHMSEVFGANMRRVREEHGLTLDAIATEARRHGLKWSTGRVHRVETGETRSVGAETLVLMPLILSTATRSKVTLDDLLSHGGPVTMPPGVTVRADSILHVLSGEDPRDVQIETKPDALSLADERAASKLGWDVDTFNARSRALWGRTLAEEAKARAPEGATAQKIGHQTRSLLWEIAKHGWEDAK